MNKTIFTVLCLACFCTSNIYADGFDSILGLVSEKGTIDDLKVPSAVPTPVPDPAPDAVPAKSKTPQAAKALPIDMDENFNPSGKPSPKVPTSDGSITDRLSVIEANQAVIIDKLAAIDAKLISKADVDQVVRKAITDLVLPNLVAKSTNGAFRTIVPSPEGNFNLAPGEIITSIDGKPVGKPMVITNTVVGVPVISQQVGGWEVRHTAVPTSMGTVKNTVFGKVRISPITGTTVVRQKSFQTCTGPNCTN